MNNRSNPITAVIGTVLLTVAATSFAADKGPGGGEAKVYARGAEVFGPFAAGRFEGDIRDLPTVRDWRPGDPIKDIPDKVGFPVTTPVAANPVAPGPDPLVTRQRDYVGRGFTDLTAPIHNFDGVGFQGLNPSDPVLDVGTDYVIAAVNGSLTDPIPGGVFVVHDKSTGARVAGPTKMALLIAQVGTPCASPAGFSDPIVMYDEIADRWMMAEIGALVNNTVCLYVSMTSDPVAGGWFGYTITTPVLPDYPKFGIWSDGYYMTSNENLGDGSAIYAIDRFQLENGLPITPQRTIPAPPSLSGFSFQAFTPADIDGPTPPPAGAPNFLVRHRDDEVHGGINDPTKDFLEIWEYAVDFVVPANTTITGPIDIPISEFSSHLCGLSAFECFRQPNTGTTLDPLRELVMFRWAYRNFGSHETLLGNLVTDLNPGDNSDEHGGIRWVELRRPPGGAWSLYQEGTYSIDDDDRWMGASAMDKDGNIAVSYSVSSENTHPAIRYTGRRASDPLGVMTQGEFSIVESNASNGSNRWGDYADTVVDPVDGCTFWTHNNYVVQGGQWRSRVASFRFASCGDADIDGVPNETDNCPNTANAGQEDGDVDGVGDACDNCSAEANADQCNTNDDAYGNVCDADLDNNGIINSFDLSLLRNNFGASGDNDADITCDGIVNSFDLTQMRQDFGSAPGPSGLE